MVGIVLARAQHTAKIRAKSLIVLEKNFFNQRAPMQRIGIFGRKSVQILPSGKPD
jgi:hypothetical protein